MATPLEQLIQLHRVDSQLRGLKARLAGSERHLAAQEQQIAALERQRGELQTQQKQLQARNAALEVENASVGEREAKLRLELGKAETSKLHSAILNELNVVKAERSDIEGRILVGLEQVEKLDAEIARVAAAIAQREPIRELASRELDERRAEIADRLAQLERERAAAAAVIPETTMKLLDRIAEMHDGEALAPVEEMDRRNREYACGACNMHLPIEAFSRLSGPGGAIVQCGSCLRILYLSESPTAAVPPKAAGARK
ncbi:MAG TPA: hypothetical protein PKC43_03885 [Phycisphaerales bacterium]|nr:hypothetical protein [Phycisphaerales bacterium]HMP36567.1 hypothetical protein [Phycisphaerales bacterium]